MFPWLDLLLLVDALCQSRLHALRSPLQTRTHYASCSSVSLEQQPVGFLRLGPAYHRGNRHMCTVIARGAGTYLCLALLQLIVG